MEKLIITEEIANHEANAHLNLEVELEVEVGQKMFDDCPPKGTVNPEGPGEWKVVLGSCIWVPAP